MVVIAARYFDRKDFLHRTFVIFNHSHILHFDEVIPNQRRGISSIHQRGDINSSKRKMQGKNEDEDGQAMSSEIASAMGFGSFGGQHHHQQGRSSTSTSTSTSKKRRRLWRSHENFSEMASSSTVAVNVNAKVDGNASPSTIVGSTLAPSSTTTTSNRIIIPIAQQREMTRRRDGEEQEEEEEDDDDDDEAEGIVTGHVSSEDVGRVENEEMAEDEVGMTEGGVSLHLPTGSTTKMRAAMTMPTGLDQTYDRRAALSVDEQEGKAMDSRRTSLHGDDEASNSGNRSNNHDQNQHQSHQSQNYQHRHQYQEWTKEKKKSLPNRNGVWQGDEGGYYDVSFVEDPWLSLLSSTS